jgi:flagellar basal-body rod protein FlgC
MGRNIFMVQINQTTLSALQAFGLKFQVTANNIANVNTDGFKKSRADLKDNHPAGVEAVISRIDTPGFLRPAEDGSPEMRESSNVELEEELVGLIGTARAYQANIKALKREEETTGSVLDLIAR